MMRNIEHSYTHILDAFNKVKRVRDQIQDIRVNGVDRCDEPVDVVDMILEAQQDLLKVLAGLV